MDTARSETQKVFKNTQFLGYPSAAHKGIVILAWYALEANQEHGVNSIGDRVIDKGVGKRKERIIGTPREICLQLSSIMK